MTPIKYVPYKDTVIGFWKRVIFKNIKQNKLLPKQGQVNKKPLVFKTLNIGNANKTKIFNQNFLTKKGPLLPNSNTFLQRDKGSKWLIMSILCNAHNMS